MPPNPPQALGEGKDKMLVWPTAAMCRGSSTYTGASSGGDMRQEVQHESSPLSYQSFFRRQVLKQNLNQKVSENGELKHNLRSSTKNMSAQPGKKQDLLCAVDRRSPSAGTMSSDSYHAQSSSTSLGKRQRGHISHLSPGYSTQNVTIHVQTSSTGCISSTYRACDLPDGLSLQIPKLLRPSNPEQRRATLMSMTPMIVYTEFLCPDVCRTRGICVHFSFVLGGKQAPDGLICQFCCGKGNEKAVHAERMCARHNNRKLSSFTVNLAEDILATRPQSVRAHEILARSLTCDWDDVPLRIVSKSKAAATSQYNPTLPIHISTGLAADCDVAVSSIVSIFEDEGQVTKKVKTDGDEEAKQHDNPHKAGDGAQTSMNLEEQELMLDELYTTNMETLMDDADQEFNDGGA